MPQYLLSVWHDDDYEVDFSGEDMQRIGPKVGRLNEELAAAGAEVFGGGLEPARAAVAFRPGEGDAVDVSDGPVAGPGPVMGGFWVIEAPDLDAAREWGRKAALATEGPVEVRPFQAG